MTEWRPSRHVVILHIAHRAHSIINRATTTVTYNNAIYWGISNNGYLVQMNYYYVLAPFFNVFLIKMSFLKKGNSYKSPSHVRWITYLSFQT